MINYIQLTISDIENSNMINKNNIVLVLHIDSHGGYVKYGKILVQFLKYIKQKNIKIITIGYEYVQSMAADIHMMGDEKYLHWDTSYVIHNHRYVNQKTDRIYIPTNFKKIYKTKQYKNRILHYMKYLSIDKKELKKELKHDLPITHTKCIKYNFSTLILNKTNSDLLINLIDSNTVV